MDQNYQPVCTQDTRAKNIDKKKRTTEGLPFRGTRRLIFQKEQGTVDKRTCFKTHLDRACPFLESMIWMLMPVLWVEQG